jgi:hypothetical protein
MYNYTEPQEVDVLRQEVARLKELVDVTSNGTAEARYFELHKRHRELNVKYEAERARVAKLMSQITQTEKERLESEAVRSRGVVLPSQRAGAQPAPLNGETNFGPEGIDESEELRLKLDRTMKTNAVLRKTNDELKREVLKMKKVVALELGEDADAAMASVEEDGEPPSPGSAANGRRTQSAGQPGKPNNNQTGWRSRAQQIALLKSKTKELSRQLTASRQALAEAGVEARFEGADNNVDFETMTIRTGMTGMTGLRSAATGVTAATGITTATAKRDFDDVNRERIEAKEQKRVMELRDIEKQIDGAKSEVVKERNRADALQARLGNLERDNQHLRLCVGRMMEKTENDDALIAEYKNEMERHREELRAALASRAQSATAGRRGPPKDSSFRENQLAQEVARLNDTISALRRQQANTGIAHGTLPIDALFEAKQVSVDDDTLLGQAFGLIQSQREAIYSMERQLQKAEGAQTRNSSDLPALVREENAALRERIGTLTAVSEREIILYKSAADHFRPATRHDTPPTAIGGPLPVGRGRRPSSSSQAGPRPSSNPRPTRTATVQPSAADDSD